MNAVFPEFPNLKFVLPHLGGTSVFLRGRISMISFEPPDFAIPPEKRQIAKTQREQRALGLDKAFEERWGKFYFDTAGTGGWAPAVEMTAAVVTPQRMVFGSDYPLESTSGATVGELVDMIGNLRLDVGDRREPLPALAVAAGSSRPSRAGGSQPPHSPNPGGNLGAGARRAGCSVLFLAGEYPPRPGGVGDYTALLAAHLADQGVRVAVLA